MAAVLQVAYSNMVRGQCLSSCALRAATEYIFNCLLRSQCLSPCLKIPRANASGGCKVFSANMDCVDDCSLFVRMAFGRMCRFVQRRAFSRGQAPLAAGVTLRSIDRLYHALLCQASSPEVSICLSPCGILRYRCMSFLST